APETRIKGSKLNRHGANRNSPTSNECQRASVECGGDSRYNEPSYRPIGLVETGPAKVDKFDGVSSPVFGSMTSVAGSPLRMFSSILLRTVDNAASRSATGTPRRCIVKSSY